MNKKIGTLLHAASVILLVALPFFFIVFKRNYLANADAPALEMFIRANRLAGRFYLQGVRAYYVQRSVEPGSEFFYDINGDTSLENAVKRYGLIRFCFDPDYWIINSALLPDHERSALKSFFSKIMIEEGKSFVAQGFVGSLEVSKGLDCASLNMLP